MRHKWLLLPLALLLLLPITASRSDAKGDINFTFGLKRVEDFEDVGDEEDLGNQFDLGLEMTFRGVDWPVGIAVDLLGSAREEEIGYYYVYLGGGYYIGPYYDVEFQTSTAELDIGIRKIWESPRQAVRPYIGGGIGLARGEVEVSGFDPLFGSFSDSFDDTGVGYWVGGGVFWRIGESFNIGLNARYSSAEVELFKDAGSDEEVDVGGLHAGLLLGWGW